MGWIDRRGRIVCSLPGGPGEADPEPDDGSGIIRALISAYVAPPAMTRPRSGRVIAAERAKVEERARNAAAAVVLRGQIQRGFRVPHGRVFGVDVQALLIVGPAGALGTSPLVAKTLEILAQGGRHAEADLVAAGWTDAESLRQGLTALGPKLAALGLRADRRRAGIRIGRVRPA